MPRSSPAPPPASSGSLAPCNYPRSSLANYWHGGEWARLLGGGWHQDGPGAFSWAARLPLHLPAVDLTQEGRGEAAAGGAWGQRLTSRVQRLAGFSTKNLRRMLSQSVDM